MQNSIKRTDEELVRDFRCGDKRACELLLVRYKNGVLSIARRFFLAGGDTEDLVQEGMCGLYSAIMSYGGNTPFSAYAHACIKNRILDAVKRSGSNKNSALNGSVALSDNGDDIAKGGFSPEDALIDNETEREFYDVMARVLSPLEYKAMRMYMDGATMSEISGALGKTYKQTDNALMRAKQKLRKELNK